MLLENIPVLALSFLIIYVGFGLFNALRLALLKNDPNSISFQRKRNESVKTLIIMGSGGHTGEMITLLSGLDFQHFSPRIYVVAKTDTTSRQRVEQLETSKDSSGRNHNFVLMSRSREVHQSWITTIFSTGLALAQSFVILLQYKADLILCNGPGTCVPICLASFILKAFWIRKSTVVFVESICRVKSMSLTGKIMNYLADCCIVQWPDLQCLYPKTIYLGRLV